MRFWNYQKGAICCDVYFSNSPLELTLLPDSVTCTMARVRKRRTIGGRAGGRGRKVCPILWLIREGKRCDASPIIELITQVPCWIIREFPLWTCAVNNLSVQCTYEMHKQYETEPTVDPNLFHSGQANRGGQSALLDSYSVMSRVGYIKVLHWNVVLGTYTAGHEFLQYISMAFQHAALDHIR